MLKYIGDTNYMISDDEKAKIKQEIVSKVNSVLEIDWLEASQKVKVTVLEKSKKLLIMQNKTQTVV